MDRYIRKYRVLITDKDNTALEVTDLRCVFMIEKTALQSANYATVIIYNLDARTEEAIIREGQTVIIEAGYEGNYGVIFQGSIFQPTWDRENVTDTKLTVYCMDGNNLIHQNFVSFNAEAGYKYNDIILQMAKNARTEIPVGVITEDLNQSSSPRGKVVFGDWKDTAREIASANSAQFFIDDGKLNYLKVTDVPKGEALVITPKTGLIGTARQTDEGFNFKCLLDPSIRLTNPCMMVKLDNTFIQQQKAEVGQKLSRLDQNMIGIVIAVRYIGDTQGTEWYNEVTCLTSGGKAPLALSATTNTYALPDMVSVKKEDTN